MTTRKDLEQTLRCINYTAAQLGLAQFVLDPGPQGRYRLVDHTGRGVLGASTGLGMASVPKRDLLWRMEGFLAALEQIETTTESVL